MREGDSDASAEREPAVREFVSLCARVMSGRRRDR